jgi:hypothetical protein
VCAASEGTLARLRTTEQGYEQSSHSIYTHSLYFII